ncbi:FecR family protein [Neorhizobium sp. NCHU2750]|uniref:FecR family protein n=1 Tax=Neorhizobium sp. NCHU2750 TaxID=1825976 RepID=UPI000EB68339|nr:transmembrane sensor [Neorhizobium sp. NCHU2750]
MSGDTKDRKLRAQAVDWLLRLQDAAGDDALEAQFQAWLSENPAHGAVFDRVQRAMGDASRLLTSDIDFARNAAHNNDHGPLTRPRNIVAALILCLAGSTAFYLADGPMRLRADVMTGTGERQTLTLADGSTLDLNAETAIAIHLEPHERRITLLRGEAYVHVAADPARPFIVEAGRGTTTALGTAFDVNLTDENTTVVVTEHAVTVASAASGGAERLPENQQISYDPDGRLGSPQPADGNQATAWRQGRIVFEDRPLLSVVEEIDRYIPGRIVIAQSALAGRRISGSLDLSEPQKALDAFAGAIGIKVTRLSPYLTILRQ